MGYKYTAHEHPFVIDARLCLCHINLIDIEYRNVLCIYGRCQEPTGGVLFR